MGACPGSPPPAPSVPPSRCPSVSLCPPSPIFSRAPRPPAVIRLLEVDALAVRAPERPLDRGVAAPPLDRHIQRRFPDLTAGGVDDAGLVSRSRGLEVPLGESRGLPQGDPGAHAASIGDTEPPRPEDG